MLQEIGLHKMLCPSAVPFFFFYLTFISFVNLEDVKLIMSCKCKGKDSGEHKHLSACLDHLVET
jgi:hypothetical protein